MTDLRVRCLPAPLRPLANKFYRAHRSPMRAHADDQVWVAEHGEIAAALCLRVIAGGHWLTGLLVAPDARGQGLARALVEHALAETTAPVWLFCHPQLSEFYRRVDFLPALGLPAELQQRLLRYQRSKTLVALMRVAPEPLPLNARP
ncbi:GNAT family N-acetyltransferase [Pseudomonas borbori]